MRTFNCCEPNLVCFAMFAVGTVLIVFNLGNEGKEFDFAEPSVVKQFLSGAFQILRVFFARQKFIFVFVRSC